MKLELTEEGKKRLFGVSQQFWHETEEDNFAAVFAGQDMLIAKNWAGKFELIYMGHYKSERFSTVAEAVEAAPDFAQTVLSMMISDIVFPPTKSGINFLDGVRDLEIASKMASVINSERSESFDAGIQRVVESFAEIEAAQRQPVDLASTHELDK